MASEESEVSSQEAATHGPGDARHTKIVITEMDEFVLGLQPNGETRRREAQDVFTDQDGDAASSGTVEKDDTNGLALRREEAGNENQAKEWAVKPDAVIHEVAVGKGLAGALKFLQDRGTLNDGEGETSDKKKINASGFKDGPKEIRIERTDEFGRVMTMKEAKSR